ncbi:PUA-like domain-containing protein [Mycena albidolilacea]|uniref:PUA-like domain-containing protein n=1 Tax=Mycena albidolilacea TaxID=1033008 RepID=A0AAD6ZFV6_9AGAR|nr:PUA-like domain-containing protein [Mycena albidolilacea]
MGLEALRRQLAQDENLFPPHIRETQNMGIDSKYGKPKGVPVGTWWPTRQECCAARVHRTTEAGIHGCKDGAFSVVMSGVYDDVDDGETFVYIGTGGRQNSSSCADQSMERKQNQYLVKSFKSRKVVRVVRGKNPASKWAPASGYRYDGLYFITEAWEEKGKTGFKVCKFRFKRLPDQLPLPEAM